MSDSPIIKNHAAFIWSIADLLRGDYKQSEYGKVVLPLTVLRRLDCVLEPTKEKVLEKAKSLKGKIENQEPVLCAVAKEQFFNTSKLDMKKLLDDPTNLAANLRSYIAAFSTGARDVLEKFDLDTQIVRMDKANILYLVVSKFAEIDLHPTVVSNLEMGYLYEELIRKFSELSNETAGEHFTPREVISLIVNLLFIEDGDVLSKEGTVRTLFDPACGTGGMLSIAEDHLRLLNPKARLEVFGQELNAETYAICRSDMMLKGQDATHITYGNSFKKSEDGHRGRKFDYCIANPPFGVDWKKVEKEIKDENENDGFSGRFGAGLPTVGDGSLLFLQHMISKMKSVEEGGSRIAIVFNGSPLSKGTAGSGESEIRRWIIENDWLEAVVALPDKLFYNTEIGTYFWIVTNRKSHERAGLVQLIDAHQFFTKQKPIGKKRKEISENHIRLITEIYGEFQESEFSKIFANSDFGFLKVPIGYPLRATWNTENASEVFNVESALLNEMQWERLISAGNIVCDNPSEFGNKLKSLLPTISDKQVKKLTELFKVLDRKAALVRDTKGSLMYDTDLSDSEYVPIPSQKIVWEREVAQRFTSPEYKTAISEYITSEVEPYSEDVQNAKVSYEKIKLGYEIPMHSFFYRFNKPRQVKDIDAEVLHGEAKIAEMLIEVSNA